MRFPFIKLYHLSLFILVGIKLNINAQHTSATKQTACPSWVPDTVFYEIYPQTFYDTDGNGISDLKGFIEKLDYVRRLGVSAIWLNPFYESPFRDAGYDVSDFYKVAPGMALRKM